MSTINVDDRDSSITYQGRWSSSGGDPKFFDSTISATNNNGATATFRFRGTQVKLFLVVPIGSSGTVKISSVLDDRAPSVVERNVHSELVYNDQWFDAATLPNTEHTLVITNIGTEGGNAMQIDRFETDGSPISPAAPPPPPPPNTPSPTSTQAPQRPPVQTAAPISSHIITSAISQTNTAATTNSAEPTPGIPSSDSVSSPNTSGSSHSGSESSAFTNSASDASASPSQASIHDKTVTAIQITTAPNGSVQTITTIAEQQGSQAPLGAILGGVVGALVLLVIAGILAFLLIRRRRKRRRGAIDPFAVLVEDQGDSTPNSATILRQPSLGPTDTSNARSRSWSRGFNSDEKRGDLSNTSAELPDQNHSSSGTPTTEVGANNLHIRPQYLSGETLPAESLSMFSQAGSLSAGTHLRLNLQDSRDFPPSYQSVGNRASDVQQSPLSSSHLSYLSPGYSAHGPTFGFGSPTAAEPQAR
ncbi:hypothetical protein CVT24_000645 [Panaeolus cyanescens]|uniref:Uncharacterized protein n=1 Tax=Panaeolus cyanescens TaxID=181874 RepID=A0A409YT76_9AGAR|nr:hypothetical protein CVT24_000645 [Panaeolus cyanescens]